MLENFNTSLERMKVLGYEIIDIDLPLMPYSLAVYYVLQPAEASSNLSRFDGVKYGLKDKGADLLATYMQTRGSGFGMETRRRILLGTYVLSHGYYDAYYRKAVNVRDQITAELDRAFETVAIIATPTTPTPAFKIGEKTTDPVQMYLSDIFTVPANIAGNPAISVPSGESNQGLPYGIQFMAPHFGEKVLLLLVRNLKKRTIVHMADAKAKPASSTSAGPWIIASVVGIFLALVFISRGVPTTNEGDCRHI